MTAAPKFILLKRDLLEDYLWEIASHATHARQECTEHIDTEEQEDEEERAVRLENARLKGAMSPAEFEKANRDGRQLSQLHRISDRADIVKEKAEYLLKTLNDSTEAEPPRRRGRKPRLEESHA